MEKKRCRLFQWIADRFNGFFENLGCTDSTEEPAKEKKDEIIIQMKQNKEKEKPNAAQKGKK